MNSSLDNYQVVYVTIRSSNSGDREEIVHIAAKFEYGELFAKWLKPATTSAKNKWQVQGLKVDPDESFFGTTKLELIIVMREFLDFLKKNSSKPVVLVGHRTKTIYSLLLRAIFKVDWIDEFHSVIAGFGDSLPAFMKKYSSKNSSAKDFEILALARNLLKEEYTEQSESPANRLRIIENLVNKSALRDAIVQNSIPFETAALGELEIQYSPVIIKKLLSMRAVLTLGMLKKVAQAGISLDVLKEIHQQAGSKGLIRILSARGHDGLPKVTDNAKALRSIADFFDRLPPPESPDGHGIYTIHYPTYKQAKALLENSKQAYTKIIRGKDNRPLYTIEYIN